MGQLQTMNHLWQDTSPIDRYVTTLTVWSEKLALQSCFVEVELDLRGVSRLTFDEYPYVVWHRSASSLPVGYEHKGRSVRLRGRGMLTAC